MPRTPLRFVSLFSGCGGFDLGFVRHGFRCEVACDIDSSALANHKRFLGAPTLEVDLACGKLVGPPRCEPDLLLAGPPCQGFSLAGKRLLDDPRNHLLLAAGRIALQLRPTVCLIENVPGVAAGVHGKYWKGLQSLLRSGGYRTAVLECSVQQLGLAQMRKRLVLVAWNNGRSPSLVLPSVQSRSLRDALEGVEKAPNHLPELLDPQSQMGKIARRIAPGQKLCNVRGGPRSVHTWDLPEVFGRTTALEREILEAFLVLRRRERKRLVGDADPVSLRSLARFLKRDVRKQIGSLVVKNYVRKMGADFDLCGTFNGKFKRLQWDEPSFAVDTRFGNPRYFLHPSENRGFTVREAARIQGFSDEQMFVGTSDSQYRMIGNAVPPVMGEALAKMVRSNFFQ